MIDGNFSEVRRLSRSQCRPLHGSSTIRSLGRAGSVPGQSHDLSDCPDTSYTSGYLNYACRPSFTSEYGETGSNVNTIPASRHLTSAPQTMIAILSQIAASIGTATTNDDSNNQHGQRLHWLRHASPTPAPATTRRSPTFRMTTRRSSANTASSRSRYSIRRNWARRAAAPSMAASRARGMATSRMSAWA